MVSSFVGERFFQHSETLIALTVGIVVILIVSMAGWRDRFWGGGRAGGGHPSLGAAAYPTQVSDEDYSYITTDDITQPPRAYDPHHGASRPSADDDTLVLRIGGSSITLHFQPYSIDHGHLRIADLRIQAARILEVGDPARLKMFYKGRPLTDDLAPCRDEGLKINSEILCRVSEEAPDSGYGQRQIRDSAEGNGSDSEPDDSSAPAGDETGRRRRNRNRKKKNNRKSEASTAGSLNPGLAPAEVPSGATSRTATPGPAPAPTTSLQKLNDLSSHFNTKLLPQCVQFTSHPPSDPAKRDYEHRKLAETILTEVILKLDAVDTEGDGEARQRRKELVKQTQGVLNGVDAVMKGGGP